MARLPILIAPDPRLKAICDPVETVDDGVRQLLDDMYETMIDANGIGLAAPQVGVTKRVIVVAAPRDEEDDDGEGRSKNPLKLVNPEVVWESDEEVARDEGCLSLPDHYSEVWRPEKVRVRYLDPEGETREIEADGLLAVCLQHEIDHLDGILFVDHISTLKRKMILRKLNKSKRLNGVVTA
mgnify:CR=1 FL=1